jgi:UDP-N-acetyl-D-glucosamine/UDP-N-acetyl-D-galactosamine dehydrogenase
VVKKIIHAGKNVLNARVLVMGTTFKENVSDIRNSKVADVVNELKTYGVVVDIIDPHASAEEVYKEYGYRLSDKPGKNYDAIVLAVAHNEYLNLKEDYFASLLSENGILMDVKGIYRNTIRKFSYASL